MRHAGAQRSPAQGHSGMADSAQPTTGPDAVSALLPSAAGTLASMQEQFATYQSAAFEDRPPGFFALELCGEAGELANLEKKIWRDPTALGDAMQKALQDEAADVFISLMNLCNARHIDLAAAITTKLQTIDDRRRRGLMGKTRTT